MKAKEMFEEINFKRKTTINGKMIIYSSPKNNIDIYHKVAFCKEYKCIELVPLRTTFIRLNKKELLAIHQQMVELGWVK